MRDDSIWKKEISFGRKKQPAEPPVTADAPPVEAASSPDARESTSFWKKEISLGRKKQKDVERLADEAALAFAPVPHEQPAPIEPELVPAQPAAPVDAPVVEPLAIAPVEPVSVEPVSVEPVSVEPVSVEPLAVVPVEPHVVMPAEPRVVGPAEPLAVAPVPVEPVPVESPAVAPAAEPEAEIEVLFARHPNVPVEPAPLPAPEPEATSELPAPPVSAAPPAPSAPPTFSVAPDPVVLPDAVVLPDHAAPPPQVVPAAPPVPPAVPAPAVPAAGVPFPEPRAHVSPAALEPLPEPPPLPAEAESVARALASQPEPQPQFVPPAPAAPVAPAEEQTGMLPAAGPAPSEAARSAEAASEPVASPTVVHPPVPAAELQPLPGDAPAASVPFWKKEISFSRKPKPQTAVMQAPKQAGDTPAAPARPFWRKQIAIGRRRPASADAGEVSIWKKELSLSRKPKAQAAAETAVAAAAVASVATADKVPFWKKEIGGKKKQPAVTGAAAAKPQPNEKVKPQPNEKVKPQPKQKTNEKAKSPQGAPFWKRELSLKSLTASKAGKASATRSATKQSHAKAKRLVGLKIGASQIAAARVSNNGVAELLQVARQPIEQGIVVGGELRDPEALAEQLKAFFSRNKLPKKNVRLGIASNRIGVRIFDVAGIDDEAQLENAIHFRAQEALPIPLDEAVLDYHVLGESVDANGQSTHRILLVVAYRELVERYVSACKRAGISLLGVDLEAFALLRALAAPREEDGAPRAALVGVAIGHDRSTFAVSDGRVCEFTRVLEWGGASLNVGIARALDLAPSEVESIKRAISLENTTAVPEGLTAEQWPQVLDVVRRQLQSFARELVSSLQFYQNQPGSLGIGEIVLTGGTAHMPGLAAELQRLISVQVRVGDPLARLKVGKKVGEGEQIGSLAVAIGLGIED
jgi:type IV pilus assembly protein PilM